MTQADLFSSGLEQTGPPPDRVIYVEMGDDVSVLAFMEEGLRHGGLGAVVADVTRLSMTASRRPHLAAKARVPGRRDGRRRTASPTGAMKA